VILDEDRAVYAAWGLGLGSVWYVLNPASQVAGFRETGWLGATVATSVRRTESMRRGVGTQPNGAGVVGAGADEDPAMVMGNKWQQAGAWAVDGRGTVVWGGKALRVDDVMDLEAGIKALGL
jgi:hypothetical protein